MHHGERINKHPSTPTVNADSSKGLETYSLNRTEVGHGLGKEILLWQQTWRAHRIKHSVREYQMRVKIPI